VLEEVVSSYSPISGIMPLIPNLNFSATKQQNFKKLIPNPNYMF
jgi:hypothetical protein